MKTRLPVLFVPLIVAAAQSIAANTPPTVRIESPKEGLKVSGADDISFKGSATDLEDGDIAGDRLVWTSDLDNSIGEGKSFVCRLSEGNHIIILTATDSNGAKGRGSVFVMVEARPKPAETPVTPRPSEKPQAQPRPPAASAPGKTRLVAVGRLKGVCYGPFRDNEGPDVGVYPTAEEMEADFSLVPKVASAVRTYGASNTPGMIPELCDKAGVDCYAGAWLGKAEAANAKEIEALLKASAQRLKHTRALIVGNEVLLRKDLSEDELVGYIRQVKKATELPVTTAEDWHRWLKHPSLANEVDFLLVHAHPYWEGVHVENAGEHVFKVWKYMMAAFPGKRVVIGETGWPSEGGTVGEAVAGRDNQARFMSDFAHLAEKEGIEYFYFEAFDEKWKAKFEGSAGACWGIYNSDGSLKKHMVGIVTVNGITRKPRKVSRVDVSAPLLVYTEPGSDRNGVQPSGWTTFSPQLALPCPVGLGRDTADMPLGDRLAPSRHPRQVEQFLLDVRGQVKQVHDLRHPGAGDVAQAGDVGLVADTARFEQAIEVDRQGHQARDTRHTAGGSVADGGRARLDSAFALIGHREVYLSRDGQLLEHVAFSPPRALMPVGWNVTETASFWPSYSTLSTSSRINLACSPGLSVCHSGSNASSAPASSSSSSVRWRAAMICSLMSVTRRSAKRSSS